ncbi:hypothetical protein L2E82_22547 [Cichorium intybus]|uniref:Uncharacterized protein n=1 Tax=Cichorium intybus TaxID=13427 RepID=A0ACB9DYC6_CICIN|nr:hypothetical protein L2E82_22547 [Cichorium intybus]
MVSCLTKQIRGDKFDSDPSLYSQHRPNNSPKPNIISNPRSGFNAYGLSTSVSSGSIKPSIPPRIYPSSRQDQRSPSFSVPIP